MTIKDYLKGEVRFDSQWGQIMVGSKNIAMMRGWSAAMEAFDGDPIKVEQFQKELGNFMAEAIKEKIEKL